MYLYHSKTIKFSYHNNAILITVNIASLMEEHYSKDIRNIKTVTE